MKGLLFTYLMTYGGAAVAIFNPFVGFLIYVCFAIVQPPAMWFWAVPQGNYSRIVALALLAGWTLQGFGKWNLGRGRAVVNLLIGFWFWAFIGMLQAPNQVVAQGYVEALAKIVLPFLVGITNVDSIRKLKQMTWVILLSQGYVALEMNLSYYSGFNRVLEIGFAGMDNNAVSIAMVTSAGMAFFFGLEAPGWWRKALAITSAGLMVHVVLFAMSRGGMLALTITGLVSMKLIPKRPKHYVALTLALLMGLRLAGPEVQQRYMMIFTDSSDRDTSAQSRVDLWGDCWDSMLKRPVLGIGPDHWPLIAAEYGWPDGKEAHSLWMQTGAEMGFPGLILLMSFYGVCVVRLWPLAKESRTDVDPLIRGMARMVIAALVGFAASAQFVSLEALEVPYYIALIGAGVLKLTSTQPPAPGSGHRGAGRSAVAPRGLIPDPPPGTSPRYTPMNRISL